MAKKKRGRPAEVEMPERIDASPEEIAEVVLMAKPPKEWDYLKPQKEEGQS
ncbi:MAG: hypothetical protein OXN21_09115 [Chloroflexota bacterium]|nr:hypothetical protein [Chloroflexota bacterium]